MQGCGRCFRLGACRGGGADPEGACRGARCCFCREACRLAVQIWAGCCKDGGAIGRTGCGGEPQTGEARVGKEKVVDSHVRAFERKL